VAAPDETRAPPILGEDAVEHECVRVHIDIERRSKALNDRYRPPSAVRDPLINACAATKPAEHAPHENADHGPRQPVIPREQVPYAMRHGQHPLANRDVRKNVFDQMRRALGHSSPAA
jgi:hypothetical protein